MNGFRGYLAVMVFVFVCAYANSSRPLYYINSYYVRILDGYEKAREIAAINGFTFGLKVMFGFCLLVY